MTEHLAAPNRPIRTSRRHLLRAAVLCAGLATLAACGSAESTHPTGTVVPSTVPTTTVGAAVPAAAEPAARVADVHGPVTVLDAPHDGATPLTEIDETTELGSRAVLLVLDERDGWLQVALPVRPNGSKGWIPSDAAAVTTVSHRVEIDLAARTLVVWSGDTATVRSAVAIGTDETPTPTGTFFVTDLVETGTPNGPYGPFALGLSGHSDVLDQFGGGDGQIGIHGTNAPDSIGQAASHGCVRVPNEVVAALVQLLPLGTPVTIS